VSTEAFPLQWPEGWQRTKRPERSRFDTAFAAARDELLRELELMGARHIVISTNVQLRRDGLPYARMPEPDDRGVAVYFMFNGRQQCIPCDRWDKVRDNIQAIRKTVEALRGLERWGAKSMVDAAFRGFEALPGPDQTTDWRAVLGVPPDGGIDEARHAYRKRRREYHPDHGGDPEMFHAVQRAWEQAQEELKC